MHLTDLRLHTSAAVVEVQRLHAEDYITQRLRDLGFVEGESVKVVARAPWGGDPILVQVGSTRFALRQSEAKRIRVMPEAGV